MNPTTPHDDGLEWLREIRRKHMQEAGGDAALRAIKSLQGSEVQVRALQEYHS